MNNNYYSLANKMKNKVNILPKATPSMLFNKHALLTINFTYPFQQCNLCDFCTIHK